MTDTAADNTDWVFIIVSNPGKNESLLGLHDKLKDIDFIPTFQSKEDATSCFLSIPKEQGVKYEVQAILMEDLEQNCKEKGFAIAMVDDSGKIIK